MEVMPLFMELYAFQNFQRMNEVVGTGVGYYSVLPLHSVTVHVDALLLLSS